MEKQRNMGYHSSILVLLLFLSAALSSSVADMSILTYDENHHIHMNSQWTNWRTDAEVLALYESWLVRHGKSYNALDEKDKRFQIFKDNLKYIDEQNAMPDRTYKLGITRFADLTNEEYRSMYQGTKIDGPRKLSKNQKWPLCS